MKKFVIAAAMCMAFGCGSDRQESVDIRNTETSSDAGSQGEIRVTSLPLPFRSVVPGGTVQVGNFSFENTGDIPNSLTLLCFRLVGAIQYAQTLAVDIAKPSETTEVSKLPIKNVSPGAESGFICPIINLSIPPRSNTIVQPVLAIDPSTPVGSTFVCEINDTRDHGIALETTDLAVAWPVTSETVTVN